MHVGFAAPFNTSVRELARASYVCYASLWKFITIEFFRTDVSVAWTFSEEADHPETVCSSPARESYLAATVCTQTHSSVTRTVLGHFSDTTAAKSTGTNNIFSFFKWVLQSSEKYSAFIRKSTCAASGMCPAIVTQFKGNTLWASLFTLMVKASMKYCLYLYIYYT